MQELTHLTAAARSESETSAICTGASVAAATYACSSPHAVDAAMPQRQLASNVVREGMA